jgi:hypothetical protein
MTPQKPGSRKKEELISTIPETVGQIEHIQDLRRQIKDIEERQQHGTILLDLAVEDARRKLRFSLEELDDAAKFVRKVFTRK